MSSFLDSTGLATFYNGLKTKFAPPAVNSLTSTSTTSPLSAAQGKILSEAISTSGLDEEQSDLLSRLGALPVTLWTGSTKTGTISIDRPISDFNIFAFRYFVGSGTDFTMIAVRGAEDVSGAGVFKGSNSLYTSSFILNYVDSTFTIDTLKASSSTQPTLTNIYGLF